MRVMPLIGLCLPGTPMVKITGVPGKHKSSFCMLVKEFKSGTITLGVNDIGTDAAKDLTGAVVDNNGVLVSAGEDEPSPVAIGFRAKTEEGKGYPFAFAIGMLTFTEVPPPSRGEMVRVPPDFNRSGV